MGTLRLNDLRPGMVLASALYNTNGVMLLPRGTRLTPRYLEQFKRWDVREALVEMLGAGPSDAGEQVDAALLAAIDRALDEKFDVQDDDEIMTEVKRVVRRMTIDEALDRHRPRDGGPGK